MDFATFFFFGIFVPSIFGVLILPFTPYLIKKINGDRELPSLVPFWVSLIILVLLGNFIWTHYFNGNIFFEWDPLITQYSLVAYQAPILDGSGTWLASGWQLWHLSLLWAAMTIVIYGISLGFALYINRNKKNYIQYKRVLIRSIIFMFALGLAVALYYSRPWTGK